MTDNEIIKALEWCSDDSSDYCCELGRGCTDGSCINELMKTALGLIQRQQERIERLKDNLDRVVAELEAEKYKGMEGLEPIKVAFNFGINKALDIVQGVSNDDR